MVGLIISITSVYVQVLQGSYKTVFKTITCLTNVRQLSDAYSYTSNHIQRYLYLEVNI